MAKHLLLLLTICALISCKKEWRNIAESETHVIESSYTGQKYQLKVLLPIDYEPEREYPIVYLTDAFLHFNTVAKEIKKLRNEIGDIILVGIFYEDYPFTLGNMITIGELRNTDLTYPVDQSEVDAGNQGGGGGLLFYQSLIEELIPMIEQRYRSNTSQRTIIGHSLGGHFARRRARRC